MTKFTKRDCFKALLSTLSDCTIYTADKPNDDGVAVPTEIPYQTMRDFIQHEIDLLDKKNANKKPTEAQVANEGYREIILSLLSTTQGYTCSELKKMDETLSGFEIQRVSSLVNALVKTNDARKETVKGKTLFYKA